MDNLFTVLYSHFEINPNVKSFLINNCEVNSYKKSLNIISLGDAVTRLYFKEKELLENL
jgi:hypothetical protein